MKNRIHPRPAGLSGCHALWLAIIMAGCTSTSVVHKEPVMNAWDQTKAVDEQKGPASTASELPPALVSTPMEQAAITSMLQEKKLPTNTITDLELTDEADVVTIIRALAKAADLNILISPQVSGRMGFAFKDIPWDQAFRSVIHSAGLTYDWEGDVLRVTTIEDMRKGLEMETVLKEREDVRAQKRRIEPMVVQVIPVKYSNAGNIGASVRMLLAAAKEGGGLTEASGSRSTVSIDEENNAIIVHAIPDDAAKAVSLVEQLDRVKYQVHIEARIVEATRETARQLGVQWGGAMAQVTDGRLVTVGGEGVTLGGYNSDFPAQFSQGILAPVGFSLGVVSEKIGGSELLAMQLTALQRKGQIQILSSPSITTLDNEPAVIESGEERAYQTTTGIGVNSFSDIEWKKAVLKLEVTPHIIDGQFLRVEIIANKDSFDETKPQSNNEYPVNTKHAKTTVLLRDGETVVIGGLAVENSSDAEAGIPFLMDIPGLGYLFKSKATAKKFDDTLIFITPRIVTATP